MNVLLHTAKENEAWHSALTANLPQAHIHAWPGAPSCEYAVLWKPPAQLLAEQQQLRAVFSLGAGVDGLLAMDSWPKTALLVRMEDAGMAGQMIEYALYAALHQFRGFDHYADDQRLQRWMPHTQRFRKDFHVGILGLGVLGAQVARALAEFGFSVNGWSRSPKHLDSIACHHGATGLEQVLRRSELLIVLLPLTPETRGLIDRRRMELLPRGAGIVNLARGGLLNEDDLPSLLESGHIGRAFLDVFATEPLTATSPLWRDHRVAITPHVAALTPFQEAALQVAKKIIALERGETVSGIVEYGRGY